MGIASIPEAGETPLKLQVKAALITEGGVSIGGATANRFAQEGARVGQFLASDDLSYVTGISLPVDRGNLAGKTYN